MAIRQEQLKKALSEKLDDIIEGKGKDKYDEEFPPKKKDDDDDDEDDDEEKSEESEEDDDDEDDDVDETISVSGSGSTSADKGPKAKKLPKGKKSSGPSMKEQIEAKYENVKKDIEKDTSADIDALIKASGLSEEVGKKAVLIFETAIKTHVANEVTKLEDLAEEVINERVAVATEALIESIDGYLDHATSEYMKENELAIEQGIRTDLAESLLSGMKSLFEQYNVTIPDGKEDLVDSLATENEGLESKLDESIKQNIELKKQIIVHQKAGIISDLAENLTDTETEKLVELAKTVDYEGEEEFTEALETLKESYFSKSTPKPVVEDNVSKGTDNPVKDEGETKKLDPRMASYVAGMDRQMAQ